MNPKHRFRTTCIALCTLLSAGGVGVPAGAQSLGGLLRDTLKDAVRSETRNQVDSNARKAVDATVDGTKNVVICAIDDRKCIRKAKKHGDTVQYAQTPAAQPQPQPQNAPAAQGQ